MRFGNDLYKQGQQNSLDQREDDYYGGYVKEERRSNYIRPNFETPGFCDSKPYFDKNYYTNKQNYGKSIGPQRCGRNFINRFCLKILIVNIMLVAFSAWMKYYDIKDPFIQEAYLNNKNQSQGSDYYYHHEENQQNIDQVFDKLNQDLKIMIEDSVNPKPTITLKDYFSFSYVS